MKKTLSGLLAALLLLTAGCAASSPPPEEGTLRVLATTYPVYLFASAVAEGAQGVEVSRLITQEISCLHDYTLSVSDMKAIERADVIVMSGAGLEDFMDDALAASQAAVIDCSSVIALLPAAGHHDHDHQEGEADHLDPHYWLDADNAIAAMEHLSAQFSALVPGQQAVFQANLTAAEELVGGSASLCALATGHSSLSAVCAHTGFITFHDGFQYFAEAFGLELLKAIEEEEGAEASAAEIREIVSLLQARDIPAIFTEKHGSDATAQAIARETGVRVAELDTLMSGEGSGIRPYVDAMRENLQTIAEALK